MKRYRKYYFVAAIITSLFFVVACNKPNDLGMDLLPSSDLISIKNVILRNEISAFTYVDDSVKTDEAEKSLLGSLNDPVFGTTTIDFAVQFRAQEYADYGSNPVADSIRLYLYYRLIYGDTVTPQTFRVYELADDISYDEDFYQNVDLKSMSYSKLLGEINYTPRVRQDSTTLDTFYQLITIPLDISLGEKLVNADSTQKINNDVFLDYFKGLYIETEKQTNTGGTILTLEAASNSSFQGSALLLYYNNDENKAAETPDTLNMPFVVSEFSARVNSINHDYSGTVFEQNLDSDNAQDSLIYVQATGGLQSKILIGDLSHWQDSSHTAINKAELVFQIDTVASDLAKFAPPSQLLLTIVDSSGVDYLPIDFYFSPAFYGGILNDDYTYRFNITQHLQQLIEGGAGNYGFFLTTAQKNSEAKRVVLKGGTSKTGIKLIITYSKFLQ